MERKEKKSEEKGKSKLVDLINVKEWEVKISIFITMLLMIIFAAVDFYRDFSLFQDMLSGIIECFIGALIGLLGLSLSGISIIVSLFTKEERELINELNGKDIVAQILSSYVFLAENVAFQCVVLFVFNVLIASEVPIANLYIFYMIIALEIYHFVFIIFYTVALIKNCIKINKIKNLYNMIDEIKKTKYDIEREIEHAYIFYVLSEKYNIGMDEIADDLLMMARDLQIDNKEEIIELIKEKYNVK